jgi:molecular chaperone GrpE
MNPEQEIDSLDSADEQTETDSSVSVDDFIRELEAKEKDLHITAETTVIELAEAFDDGELPEFMQEEFSAEAEKPPTPVAANSSREKAAKTRLEAENKQLREKLAKAEDDRDELMKASLRRSKDFESYKARVERERRQTFQNQVSNIATQMLPALDNLNRAVDFAVELPREERSEFQQFVDGVVLVNQQVNEVLSEMGIEPILTIGEPFDPHLHEAAATEETDEFEPNTISGEMLKGYRIGDRVVRHSIVRVARALPKSAEQEIFNKMFDHDSADDQDAESIPETENAHD